MSQSLNEQTKEFDSKWQAHVKAEQQKQTEENTRLYGEDRSLWPHKYTRIVDADVQHVAENTLPSVVVTRQQMADLERQGYCDLEPTEAKENMTDFETIIAVLTRAYPEERSSSKKLIRTFQFPEYLDEPSSAIVLSGCSTETCEADAVCFAFNRDGSLFNIHNEMKDRTENVKPR
jgi:hypothetical protein